MTLEVNEPTSISSWILLISRAIASYGIDPAPLFKHAGLTLALAEQDANARFSVHKMAQVWQQAVALSGDPCIALRLSQFFNPHAYHALGLAMAASTSLLECLSLCLKYYRLTSDAAKLDLFNKADKVVLDISVPSHHQPCAPEAIEAFAVTLLCLCRSMTTPQFHAEHVAFAHQDSAQKRTRFAEFFMCPVHFGASATRLVFRHDALAQRCILANPAVVDVITAYLEQQLREHEKQSFALQVKRTLMQRLHQPAQSLNDSARQLGMSARSLQRKLADEGTSFQKLLDECRYQLAVALLRNPQLPLAEVSLLIGFSRSPPTNVYPLGSLT
jgi:AraC-like DNA-binding protein